MTSNENTELGPGDWRGTLGRLAMRLADQMLGPNGRPAGRARPGARGSRPTDDPAIEQSAAAAARSLEQALVQFESVLVRMEQRTPASLATEEELIAGAGLSSSEQDFDEPPAGIEEILAELEDEPGEEHDEPVRPLMDAHGLNELRLLVRDAVRRLEDAIDRFDVESQRLSDETAHLAQIAAGLEDRLLDLEQERSTPAAEAPPSTDQTARLAQIATRLEERLNDLEGANGAAPEATPRAPDGAGEPQFVPGNGPIDLVLGGVPGFQGLMDAQRGLSGLPSSERASVVAYKNGEASLEVQLKAPITARQVVEGLRSATGHRLLIEEARPEANRLRLRFIETSESGG